MTNNKYIHIAHLLTDINCWRTRTVLPKGGRNRLSHRKLRAKVDRGNKCNNSYYAKQRQDTGKFIATIGLGLDSTE